MAAFWMCLALLAPFARADDDLDLREQKAFRAAVDRVGPSVVRIETVGGMDRVGRVLIGTGPTTGLIVTPDGYIVSSAFNFLHNPASILVQLPDGTRKPARLVASDHNRMLVLLKIDANRLPVAEIVPQSQMRVGQWAIAVGRTFEAGLPNMAVGVLSALNRVWGKAIQTDAAVSPNNYGGPLVDIHGRVLGVLVPLSLQPSKEVAGVEWYDSGIGFAIPAETIQKILPRLQQGKDLRPGVIGIVFAGRSLFTDDPVIATSRPNSPAYRSGLRAGDRIVEISGRKVTLAAEVKEEIGRRYAGETIRVVVTRNGRRSEHEVELVERLPPYEHPFLGVLPMRPIGRPEQDKQARPGVPVRFVYPEGPVAQAGIRAGDVLTTFAGEDIAGAESLRQKLAQRLPGEQVELGLRRGGESLAVTARLGRLPENVPAGPLPPAWTAPPDQKDDRPNAGKVPLKLPGSDSEDWAYVPENYNAAVAHGLLVWLDAPDASGEQEFIARWNPHCRKDHLILLVPKPADPATSENAEAARIVRLLAAVAVAYRIDPMRTVVCGQGRGGTLAYLVAFAAQAQVHAVATIDAPFRGPAPETEPARRLAFFIARADNSPQSGQIDQTVAVLRAMKYPVTARSLGQQPRDLNAAELSELLRWIDTLDRI